MLLHGRHIVRGLESPLVAEDGVDPTQVAVGQHALDQLLHSKNIAARNEGEGQGVVSGFSERDGE